MQDLEGIPYLMIPLRVSVHQLSRVDAHYFSFIIIPDLHKVGAWSEVRAIKADISTTFYFNFLIRNNPSSVVFDDKREF